MKSEDIDGIKKKFDREWLLIAVDKVDRPTTTPISGRLIAHSPHRDEIYKRLRPLRRKRNILVEYSEDTLPQGYAAAFAAGV